MSRCGAEFRCSKNEEKESEHDQVELLANAAWLALSFSTPLTPMSG